MTECERKDAASRRTANVENDDIKTTPSHPIAFI